MTTETSSPHAPVVDTTRSPYARLRPVGVGDVEVHDAFWQPRLDRNREQTIPAQHEQCETTGALTNFRRAAGHTPGEPFHGMYYSDSDVYKWAEAASWSLASTDDRAVAERLAEVIRLFEAAQDGEGYLNTYFSVDRVAERWTDLVVRHEMYCIGHLTQAAVAHFRATGSRALLDVAERACGHIEARFAPGDVPGTCGHPCLEMALVELYRATGDERWLRLAVWQLDSRGMGVLNGSEYLLDHARLRDQSFVTGHAVRALYLYAAAADVVLETGDEELSAVVDRLWADLSRHKTAVTGGVGARWDGEAFGDAYELPDRAYNETCAAIAHIFLAWRLLLRTGDGAYRDAVETALYNGVLPGLSQSGTEFFYQNPLADEGRHRRSPWFTCACCPPNIARLLASLPGYVYTTSDEGLWVQLYVGNSARVRLPDGSSVGVELSCGLPWEGTVQLRLTPVEAREFSVFLPVPAWAGEATVRVGEEVVTPERRSGYLVLTRTWQLGDEVRLDFTMPVRQIGTHPRVAAGHRRVAVTRGPLVYCVEQSDHADAAVADLRLAGEETWRPEFAADLLGGVVTLHTTGSALKVDEDEPLHRPYVPAEPLPTRPAEITAVPYYAWANREAGPMRVFLPLLP
ncbi:glycoside hydrolase family 127 protein [Actinopolymorpha singaporensis]